MCKWSIDDSAELYNINGWGLNYFSINEKGHVAVTPKTDGPSIDLKELMEELQVRDVKPRYFCDSRISWIIGSRKFLIVFRLLLGNMAIRLRISLSIRSRSIKCVLSLKRLSVMGINSISVWKQARSQSCMRYFRSISMMRP